MAKKRIIVANWKMHPETSLDAKELVQKTRAVYKGLKNISLVVCPPAVYLESLGKEFAKGPAASRTIFGAQDAHWERSGAFTGSVSPSMLRSLGVSVVILGHSERRKAGETDEIIQKKVMAALKAGLSVVLCVGEGARDEHGEYLHALEAQIKNTIPDLPRTKLEKIMIAYEPLWAIGAKSTGPATPEEVFSTTIFIRKVLTDVVGKDLAMKMAILYGGSVDAENAAPMVEHGGIEGLLVGRESLVAKSFGALLASVAGVK